MNGKRRVVLALVAVLVSALLAVPIRTGVAVTPAKPEFGPSTKLTGDLKGLTERYFAAEQLRPGEPGAIRVVERTPKRVVADMIFVHGHADRADNHVDLFRDWAKAGLHVIAADLPSHGKTGTRPIDAWSQQDLASLVASLDRGLGAKDRPLVLAGWSFGGLVVTRMMQEGDQLGYLQRRPAATVLFTPAITPYPAAGGDGIARQETLTHDKRPPAGGPPDPASPFLDPVFAVRLLAEAWAARNADLPSGIPVQVITSDPKLDKYVAVDDLVTWAQRQRPVSSIVTCSDSRHGVDLEAWPQGPAAIGHTTGFLAEQVSALQPQKPSGLSAIVDEEDPCRTR